MKEKTKPISVGIFALIILMFFLPFATVSCQGSEIAQLSGFDLAFGTEVQAGFNTQKTEPAAALIIVLLCAAAGIFLVAIGKFSLVIPLATSLLGFICMMIFRSQILKKMATGGLSIKFEGGFWMTTILLLISSAVFAGSHFFGDTLEDLLSKTKRVPLPYCPHCGTKLEGNFCSKCANKGIP